MAPIEKSRCAAPNVGKMRRLPLAFVAVLVAASVMLAWPSAAAAADTDADALANVEVTRYGGADRYETSLLVAEAVVDLAGGSVDTVVMVPGTRWTDAVVAAPLAGSLGAPLLMTPPNELRTEASEFLGRVGASRVVLVGSTGGDDPFGDAVISPLSEMGLAVERVGAADRYATGVIAARSIDSAGDMPGYGRTAIVASGEVFADALVAGPIGARGSHPVLLTPPGELHEGVADYLDDADIDRVVLMGGTAALSDAVEHSIEGRGIDVTRLAGTSRYDTAAKAAELATDRYSDSGGETCFTTRRVGLARARVPFDSFSAGPLLGRLCAPLLLADPGAVPSDTAAFLNDARAALAVAGALDLRVFGGDAAVSQTAIDAYLDGRDVAEAEDAKDQDAPEGPEVLAAGTCGGSIDDEPAPLLDSDRVEDPSWSPDCSQLVYTDKGSLWVVNNDGSDARQLTARDGAHSHNATWSPDGSKIVYERGQRNDDGIWFSHIYEVNIDGTGRAKLSKGDVEDSSPSFSPDGTKILFERFEGSERDADGSFIDADRYVIMMDASGENRTALTKGGRWEHLPSWSPDGTRIAYVSDDAVWLMDRDGSNAARAIHGAFWRGGLSFSPDGARIAFGRGDLAESSLWIADLDDGNERLLINLPGRNWLPRWSPDGQRIAFSRVVPHPNPDDPELVNLTRHAYTVGASGEAPKVAVDCRPAGISGTTAGFPLPHWAPSPTGSLRVSVLFVDFPDAQAAHTTVEEAARGLPWAEEYLEAVSYGQLDVQFVPHRQWLRAPQSYSDYLDESPSGGPHVTEDAIYADVIELVDDEIDFSGFHILAVVLPSSHFFGGTAGGAVEVDGVSLRRHINNNRPLAEPAEPIHWGNVAAHELVHNLGLLDMYPYDRAAHEQPGPPRGQEWIPVGFGLMALDAYFLADASRLLRRTTKTYPDGGSEWWQVERLLPIEMLAWSRWQLGWLHEHQIQCVTGGTATVVLAPISSADGAVAMAAVPIDQRRIIVIESRRKLGYDRGHEFAWQRGGTGRTQALIEEGVLVYTVDSFVGSGELPAKIAGDSGNGQVDEFPVLGPGDSVTVRGYTITVTADDGDTHTVSITDNS